LAIVPYGPPLSAGDHRRTSGGDGSVDDSDEIISKRRGEKCGEIFESSLSKEFDARSNAR